MKKVLGIETSCDDTSLAIIEGTPNSPNSTSKILAQVSFGQEEILKKWGGVVPEVAARNHLDKLTPLLKEVLEQSNTKIEDIDLISVTNQPGLLGPLLTGINLAKSISLVNKVPVLPSNHLFSHLEAIRITNPEVSYPYLGLLVSGGHTLFAIVKSSSDLEIIGGTIDDASGEAFDKGAKVLGLGYPGGRIIDDLSKKGDELKYSFPIGLKDSKNCNLSYSGVKTSLLDFSKRNPDAVENDIESVCASYQLAIVNALALKTKFALKKVVELGLNSNIPLVVGGGVACNSKLRETLNNQFENVYFVSPKYCADNGGMIANYGLLNFDKAFEYPKSLTIDAKSRFVEKGSF